MIYIGIKKMLPFKGKVRIFYHLISDNSTNELTAFGEKIGLKKRWIQKSDEAGEHFDLFGSKIELARQNGAREISDREFIQIIKNKRDQGK